MSRVSVSDLLGPQATDRRVELSQRNAADNASAALCDALALAGAEAAGDREAEALFELLERIDHQSRILQRRLGQLEDRDRPAAGAGAAGTHEIQETLRPELDHIESAIAHAAREPANYGGT